ncbi:MAG: hypothetical protein SGBAC_006999 [Bacillariaceae sp.]
MNAFRILVLATFLASYYTTAVATQDKNDTDTQISPGIGGDPHIVTWKDEHYDFHGQCDLVLLRDPDFANNVGLDIHIRTKVVHFWSFTESVAIKLGKDTLEIQGSANDDDDDDKPNYWINGKHQGDLFLLGGYPIFQKQLQGHTFIYQINLSPTYSNQEIVVQVYKQFVRVKIVGKDDAFGGSVGLLGDYLTGEILARDGMTVLQGNSMGDEWQVLPDDGKLFQKDQDPQFPARCMSPKSPSRQRERWLAESSISVSEAEAACAKVGDLPSIKDCVHDVLATQDLGMRAAF